MMGQTVESHRKETNHFYSCLLHLSEKGTGYIPTAYIIINKTHLDSPACCIHQCIMNQAAYRIVLYNIELHMDMVSSTTDMTQHIPDKIFSFRKDMNIIAYEREGIIMHFHKSDQVNVFLGDI